LAVIGGALLAANPLAAATTNDRPDDGDAEVLYAQGQVWNRELPGVAGELRLAFAGAGLAVIAIIGVLISLLLPAIQA
jgi:hypothetical protein